MIPLNKPGRLALFSGCHDFIADSFPHRSVCFVSTASDALNIVYKKLYEERGPLRIGVSPLTCFQAIYPIVNNGHTPVFLDIDSDTFNLDYRKLTERDDIQSLQVIHLGGNPNEMDYILAYCYERRIPLIEDCAQALGSTYKGQQLGNFGDYSAFSLIKNLHVPSGGLVVSNTELSDCVEQLPIMRMTVGQYRRMKIWLESKANQHPYNLWNWLYDGLMKMRKDAIAPENRCPSTLRELDVDEIKLRMSNYDSLLALRLRNAEMIIRELDPTKATVQQVPKHGVCNRNRIMLKLRNHNASGVIVALRQKGIAANNLTQSYINGFQPHVSKDALLGKFYTPKDLEVYDSVFPYIIAIPSSPFLTGKEIEHINHHLNKIISQA